MATTNTVDSTWATINSLKNASDVRIHGGSFTAFTNDEQAALLDLCLGIAEKGASAFWVLQTFYANPRTIPGATITDSGAIGTSSTPAS